MTDVFQEVEEGLRQDRVSQIWRRFGPLIIAFCVLIVLGTAGYELWKRANADRAGEASAKFGAARAAIAAANPQGAAADLAALAGGNHAGYKTLALMEQARLAQDRGEAQQAADLFVQASRAAPTAMARDLAILRSGYAASAFETAEQLERRLAPIAEPGGPLSPLAREIMAARHFETGSYERARALYDDIALALEAPPGLRERAQIAIGVLEGLGVRSALASQTPAETTPDAAEAPASDTAQPPENAP